MGFGQTSQLGLDFEAMGVKPDYHVSTRDLYRDIAYKIICNDGDWISYLCFVARLPIASFYLHGLPTGVTHKNKLTMPSDFSSSPHTGVFRHLQQPPLARSWKAMCWFYMAISMMILWPWFLPVPAYPCERSIQKPFPITSSSNCSSLFGCPGDSPFMSDTGNVGYLCQEMTFKGAISSILVKPLTSHAGLVWRTARTILLSPDALSPGRSLVVVVVLSKP
jgi:hypothetical protein